MRASSSLKIGAIVLCVSGPAAAEVPLSAIDWLSDSVKSLPAAVVTGPSGTKREAAISNNAAVENITVTSLDASQPDAVGLLPSSVTGLPRNLWGSTPTTDLAKLISSLRPEMLPALQDLVFTLILAELDAPPDANGTGTLLLARIDKLLDMGALEQAQALMDRAEPDTPPLFRRWFDVALLTGTENNACHTLRTSSGIAPTFPARIFCLARNGDWPAAALSMQTAKALDLISADEETLMSHFLDPELFEDTPVPRPSDRPSPLEFRMFEAIGEPIPTAALPRAFAQADLRKTIGWKSQLEAGERLARTGAISGNRLLGLYTERRRAASGGIWDRVEAFQRFDVAMKSADPGAVARALPAAWNSAKQINIEVLFAQIYSENLFKLPLSGPEKTIADQIGLLSEHYEKVAGKMTPALPSEAYLQALALGTPGQVAAPDSTAAAISDGFAAGRAPGPLNQMVTDGKLGEAILTAVKVFNDGANGDPQDISDALALFRSVGLEDTARRAALQLLLLKRDQ